jgi:hypothetical protein
MLARVGCVKYHVNTGTIGPPTARHPARCLVRAEQSILLTRQFLERPAAVSSL